MTNFFSWKADNALGRDSVFYLSETKLSKGERVPLQVVFSQTIPLYLQKQQEASVSIHCKGKNLKSAWLKVYSLDKHEKLLRTDSVDALGNSWKTHRLSIALEDASYIRLSVVVNGKDCSLHPGAEMWIDRLTLSFDGTDAGTVNVPPIPRTPLLEQKYITPLSSSHEADLLSLPPIQSGFRVLGIGESFHGSLTLEHVANQIVKTLVKYKNCKLVMVELPSMLVLKWDLYIQGYPVPFEELKEELVGSLWSFQRMEELLNLLRDYNQTAEKKVRIIGFDRNNKMYYSLMHDYFYELYKQKPDKLYRKFMQRHRTSDKMLELMKSKEDMNDRLEEFEITWFGEQYWLNLIEPEIPEVKKHGSLNMRDYIMSLYVNNAIQLTKLQENETAVVLAHWFHINKLDIVLRRWPSLGYYLSEKFGSGYVALELMGGQGTFNAYKMGGVEVCPLPQPELGTLEDAALQTKIPSFYYPISVLPDTTPINLRIQPAAYVAGIFRGLSFHTRMDGFIFVRDNEGATLPNWWKKIEEDEIKVFMEREKRWRMREKELMFQDK